MSVSEEERMAARATAAAARAASSGGTRLVSLLVAAARGPSRHRMPPAEADPDRVHLLHVVRLYRLVLQRLPDRAGLRHHAELLSSGSTLAELAASLLTVSRSAAGDREEAARALWLRAGGRFTGFEAAWTAASGLPDFVAGLVRHPVRRDDALLSALFPDGIDPALSDAGPAWAYRLWAGEIDAMLDRVAWRGLGMLRLLGPRISLLMTLDGATTAEALDASLQSLSRQIYGRWRVQLMGSAPAGWTPPADPRINRCGRAPAMGRRALSRPVLDGVLPPGAVLAPSCLALFAWAATRRPLVAGWSCDEDRIDTDGLRGRPRLHRDGGLRLRRRSRRDARGPERHLPAVLLHRPAPRSGEPAAAVPVTQGLPTASLVIVTRDRPVLLRRCLHSIRMTTAAPGTVGAPEIVVVDNGTTDPDALRLLDLCRAEGGVVLRRPGPFNWSALCNEGVRASSGAVVVLLNNDVECVQPGWLLALLVGCQDPAVGVMGARLLYADGRVQHNGVLVGSGPARWPGRWLPRWRRPFAAHRLDDPDAPDAPARAVAAVTGACMAFRRTVFDRLGGLEEALPVTWNDLDFCFRVREAGFAVRVATGCVLRHDELGTRTPDTAPENRIQLARTIAFVARRHGRILRRDRFLHPFLLFASGATLLDPSAPSRIGRLLARGGIACETASAGRID